MRTLCITLAYAGCRLSEALALTADRVDLAAGVLVFATLKKANAILITARSTFVSTPGAKKTSLPFRITSSYCIVGSK